MKQRVVEMVDAILKRMEEHPEAPHTENGIRSWLAQQGYNKRDIDDAIRLVRPRFAAPPQPTRPGPVSVRPLSEAEQQKLSPEAREALARLAYYTLIDPFEREMVLDRLNHFEGEVGLEELDYLLSWVVYSTRDFETQQTMYSVLEGQGETFH